MKKLKRILALLISVLMLPVVPVSVLAESDDPSYQNRIVNVYIGDTEFVESRTLHELSSVQPDITMRPSVRPWTDMNSNLWGVGLNGVSAIDKEHVDSEDYPYTLVGNGLCSRIMVQFDGVLPRAVHDGEDPTDPEVFKKRSIDVPGQYKLKDQNGIIYYTYCVDAATDANLQDTYNVKNVEDASYYSSEDASHIRFICINGYWGSSEGLGSLEYFKSILVSNNVLTQEEADALTPGECITATQAAIWKFGNSAESFSIDESVVVGPALKSYSFSALDWDWLTDYLESGNLIKKIYDYLVEGVFDYSSSEPATVFTKENSLTSLSIQVKERLSSGGDTGVDSYKADLSFTIGTAIVSTDQIVVEISQDGEVIGSVDLVAGQNEYTIQDLTLSENKEVSLHFEGARPLGQLVYLFESADPTVSQTLVGVANGIQHVGLSKTLSFDVSYQCECEITAYKTIDHGVLKDKQFVFELYDSQGEKIGDATNNADGEIAFSPIRFTSDMLNGASSTRFTYQIKEVIGDEQGITYDESAKSVSILLQLSGDQLIAEVESDNSSLTFLNQVETTAVPVTKSWNDNDDQDGKRPNSVTIHLIANDVDTGKTLVLNDANGWKGSFTDLPKYENGTEIKYEITEDPVKDYSTKIEGYDVENTHEPEMTRFEVMKIWDDHDNLNLKRPVSVVIHLLSNGIDTGKTIVLSETDGWKGAFEDLPAYAEGVKIQYSIIEEPVSDYSTSIDEQDENYVVLRNTYTPRTGDVTMETWMMIILFAGIAMCFARMVYLSVKRKMNV